VPKVLRALNERERYSSAASERPPQSGSVTRTEPPRRLEQRSVNEGLGGILVSRAIRNHNLWLAVGYVSLILLMARAYA